MTVPKLSMKMRGTTIMVLSGPESSRQVCSRRPGTPVRAIVGGGDGTVRSLEPEILEQADKRSGTAMKKCSHDPNTAMLTTGLHLPWSSKGHSFKNSTALSSSFTSTSVAGHITQLQTPWLAPSLSLVLFACEKSCFQTFKPRNASNSRRSSRHNRSSTSDSHGSKFHNSRAG